MHFLIAFDKFKGALTATDACSIVADVLRQSFPRAIVQEIPLTDGGDGFVEILTSSAGGSFFSYPVKGADGVMVQASYGIINASVLPHSAQDFLSQKQGDIAIVEMAQTTGLAQIPAPSRNPWKTHSTGLGELLAHIAASGVQEILLGVGGSATQDLGLPALVPLGLECFDNTGKRIEIPSPEKWNQIETIRWNPRYPHLRIRLACDVDHPLLGPRGTAYSFAHQKGLPEVEIPFLEEAVSQIVHKLEQTLSLSPSLKTSSGAGAAGGIGYGFQAILKSPLLSGANLIKAWFEIESHLSHATHVFTGEGRADLGTLEGKGPGMIVTLAEKQKLPLFILAGQVAEALKHQVASTTKLVSISPENLPTEIAMKQTRKRLQEAAQSLAHCLSNESLL